MTLINLDSLTDEDWERGRKAVEDVLIEWRDAGIFILRANGLVVNEKDGTPSDVKRLSIDMALRTGMRAIADGAAS